MLSPWLSRSLLLLTTVSAHARIRQCVDVHLCVGMVDTQRKVECRQCTYGIEVCGV